MLAVESKYYSIQAPLIYKSPVEDLDDSHMAKLVVHLVKLFEEEKPELFNGKAEVVRNSNIPNLKCWDYILLLLLGAIDHVVRLKLFSMIKAKPVCTLLMKNYLENQKSTNLKTIIPT